MTDFIFTIDSDDESPGMPSNSTTSRTARRPESRRGKQRADHEDEAIDEMNPVFFFDGLGPVDEGDMVYGSTSQARQMVSSAE